MRAGKTILLFSVIVLVMGFAYRFYEQYRFEQFCNGIPENTTPQTVMELARKEHYSVLNLLEQQGELVITNRKTPIFRFACRLNYKNQVITTRRVGVAD